MVSQSETILRQGVVKPETPSQRRDLAGLAEDLGTSPLRGKRVPLRLLNFRPDTGGYIAALGGPLPYMLRLREIGDLTDEHEKRLRQAWQALALTSRDAEAFALAWRAEVEVWSFDDVNELVDRHNRFYPAESRLPMDPKTRTFALVNGEDYRHRPLDTAWALERFPAELATALKR